MDVFSPRPRKACGYRIISLDQSNESAPGARADGWREWPAEDNRVTPADEACFRLDFTAWLDALPPKKGQIGGLLADGHETGVAAQIVGVTAGRVSQVRAELAQSWAVFQSQMLTF